MTKLTTAKGPYLTEAESEQHDSDGKAKPLIVEVGPFNLTYRVKGSHTSYQINHSLAYEVAVKSYANSQRVREIHTVSRGKV